MNPDVTRHNPGRKDPEQELEHEVWTEETEETEEMPAFSQSFTCQITDHLTYYGYLAVKRTVVVSSMKSSMTLIDWYIKHLNPGDLRRIWVWSIDTRKSLKSVPFQTQADIVDARLLQIHILIWL